MEAHADEEVFGLADVHPVALQLEGVQVPRVRHRREDLLLDRGRLHLRGQGSVII